MESLQTLCRTVDEYNCFGCHQPGRALRERSHVIVITNEGPPIVQMAHRRCMESQIVALDGALLDPHSNLSEDVTSITVLWHSPDGPLAGLIIDRSDAVQVVHRDTGDSHDPFVTFLLDIGWHLVMSTDQGFPLIDTSTIDLDHPGGRVLTHGPDTILLEPLPDPDSDWLSAARARGVVRVYAGAVGLKKTAGRQLADVMADAIAGGRVAGAYLPVT